MTQSGVTRNISSGGVLFTSDLEPDVGGTLEYVITLSSQKEHPVSLRCMGKVVRSEKLNPEIANGSGSFAVAVTLERYEFLRTDH